MFILLCFDTREVKLCIVNDIVEKHDVTEDNTRAVDLAPEKPDVLASKMKERVEIQLLL